MNPYNTTSSNTSSTTMRRRKRKTSTKNSNLIDVKYLILLASIFCLLWVTMMVALVMNMKLQSKETSPSLSDDDNIPALKKKQLKYLKSREEKGNRNISKIMEDLTKYNKEKMQPPIVKGNSKMAQKIKAELSNLYNKLKEEYQHQEEIFQKVTPEFPESPKIQPATVLQKPISLSEKHSIGMNYTSPYIIQHGCSLTVTLMDPRIALLPRFTDVWIALESLAANVNRTSTCVVLQTSECIVHNDRNLLTKLIESKSLPLFLELIHRGNVRISIINHKLYKMKNCRNFFSPSNAFMHIEFWGPQEFTEQDSDFVLVMQTDSVLCHSLQEEAWRELAYVGGPWPPKANMHNNPVPSDGTCLALPRFWSQWRESDKIFKIKEKWLAGNMTYKPPAPPPIQPSLPIDRVDVSNISFPTNLCVETNGPLGNGGFSLRSRKWMRRAIATCPHVHFSGLELNPNCMVYENIPEDLYFATILKALRAPIPTAFEASLFASEMVFTKHIIKYFGPENSTKQLELVDKRWKGKFDHDPKEKYQRMMQKGLVVPIGLHKPWWYHDLFLMLGDHFKTNCPFFEWMIIGRGWNSPM